MRCRRLALVSAALLVATACGTQPPQPEYRVTATVKDIMDALVDPSADVLWESVGEIINASGVEQRAPKTDEEWATVRRHAIQLLEATNLLLMQGRSVAQPGEKSKNPGVELAPEQIQTLINEDRAAWTKLVHGLYDSALPALKAIDAKNAQGLMDAGEGIDRACENCHLRYWYPKKSVAASLNP